MSWSHGTRAVIESVATSIDPRLGSRALAIAAASRALEAAGRPADTVEILVNAGVYRDENIIEPAMAPFIQRGIGANTTFPPLNGKTFSFDLNHGACGFLTAIRVIDGFMRSGGVRSGLVVASDVDPDPTTSSSRALPAAGGAVLLRAASDGEGFAWFHARTYSEHSALFDARLLDTWTPAFTGGHAAAPAPPRLHVREQAEFRERCLECAGATVDELSRRGDLDRDGVDLLIAAPGAGGFAQALGERLGLGRRARAGGDHAERAHTASIAFALEDAWRDGSWARARRVLFVAVSAGVTVSLALYER
jgi:3-oxoacyl-[acyl-carrier-protein] synthase-3